MSLYSVRTNKRVLNDPVFNFKEIYLLPSVVLGRSDENDYMSGITNDGLRKKATVYYIGIVFLSRAYAIEFWCDRNEEKK